MFWYRQACLCALFRAGKTGCQREDGTLPNRFLCFLERPKGRSRHDLTISKQFASNFQTYRFYNKLIRPGRISTKYGPLKYRDFTLAGDVFCYQELTVRRRYYDKKFIPILIGAMALACFWDDRRKPQRGKRNVWTRRTPSPIFNFLLNNRKRKQNVNISMLCSTYPVRGGGACV